MTDATIPAEDAAVDAKPVAKRRGGGRKLPVATRTPPDHDKPDGWARVFGILLDMERRGEMGRVIERWQVTSLTELRDALDAAIEIATEAGDTDVFLNPVDVVLAHFPRGEGKPYRVSIKTPIPSIDEA